MKLKNFVISGSIQFQTDNLYWDIDNFADFEGLELIPANDAVLMKWTVPKRNNPWACYENKFSGMNIYFGDLQFLKIGPRDPEMPFTEDACVSHVLKVDRNIHHDDPFMRTRDVWGADDPFAWYFYSRVLA